MNEELLLNAGLDRNDMNALLKTQQTDSADAKELIHGVDEKDVRTKTDLSNDEVKQMALARYYAKLIKSKKLKEMLEDLMYLKISKERKSRKEYVDALRSETDNQQGFFKNLFNRGE